MYRLLGVSKSSTFEEVQEARNFYFEVCNDHSTGRLFLFYGKSFDRPFHLKFNNNKLSVFPLSMIYVVAYESTDCYIYCNKCCGNASVLHLVLAL